MTGYVGTSGGRKKVESMHIGTASGRRQVERAWVGTASGNRLWYVRRPDLVLTATTVSASQISLSWTDLGPGHTYVVQCNPSGLIVNGSTATSHQHTGLAGSTLYAYRVDAYYAGTKVDEAHASATTQAVPPPQYQQKTWSGLATAVASYAENGSRRTDTSNAYAGRYSSTWGTQRSLWTFDIPSDVHNCASIDAVRFAVWSLHTFNNSGASVGLVVHHGSVAGSTFPGSTGIFGTYHAPKPGWIGQTPDGWVDITNAATPGRSTVREEFRVLGAAGLGLAATTTAQAGYMYAWGTGLDRPKLSITYTVRIA